MRFLFQFGREVVAFPLHVFPEGARSALRIVVSTALYVGDSSDLPQADKLWQTTIAVCGYTLHKVESLVRFHYKLYPCSVNFTIFRRFRPVRKRR